MNALGAIVSKSERKVALLGDHCPVHEIVGQEGEFAHALGVTQKNRSDFSHSEVNSFCPRTNTPLIDTVLRMEAPKAAGRLTRAIYCPDPTCTSQRIYRRRCGCGRACRWRCPKCSTEQYASNAARHKCTRNDFERTTITSLSETTESKRLLWVVRDKHYTNYVSVERSSFQVPKNAKELLIRELDSNNAAGELLMEEYNAMACILSSKYGHAVRFIDCSVLRKQMYESQHAFDALFCDIDIFVDGNWPYMLNMESDHQLFLAQMERLRYHLGIQCFPSPEDLRFVAFKHLYHGALSKSGIPVIPSVYLWRDDASAIEVALDKVLSFLTASVDQRLVVVLKRVLSESGQHVFILSGNDKTELVKQIQQKLGASPSKRVHWWLLQPLINEFTTVPELKIYFDIEARVVSVYAYKHRPLSSHESEVRELRSDLPLASEEWKYLNVDVAVRLAKQTRSVVLQYAPSLAPLLRIDVIHTLKDGFLVNEVEHFGNAWLHSQNNGLGKGIVEHFARSLDMYFRSQHRAR